MANTNSGALVPAKATRRTVTIDCPTCEGNGSTDLRAVCTRCTGNGALELPLPTLGSLHYWLNDERTSPDSPAFDVVNNAWFAIGRAA